MLDGLREVLLHLHVVGCVALRCEILVENEFHNCSLFGCFNSNFNDYKLEFALNFQGGFLIRDFKSMISSRDFKSEISTFS